MMKNNIFIIILCVSCILISVVMIALLAVISPHFTEVGDLVFGITTFSLILAASCYLLYRELRQ